jgi:hypothetical protein
MVASTINKGVRNIWVWLAILIAVAFGPTILYSALSPRPSAILQSSTTPGMLCTNGPCAPINRKPGPVYLKEIGLGTLPDVLTLQGAAAVTDERLRVFVDYSEYRNGWMPKSRAFIGEIKEPVKGKIERLQLVYPGTRPDGGTINLWWGNPSENHAVSQPYNPGIPAIIVRGRIAILGSKGEQHYYFMLVREAETKGPYVGVIHEHDLGDWIGVWEDE